MRPLFVSRHPQVDLDEVKAALELDLPIKEIIDEYRRRNPVANLKYAALGVKGVIHDLMCMGHPEATKRWETVKELFNE